MLGRLLHGYQLPGANLSEIEACETSLLIILPEDYKAFLRISNGFNDEVGQGYLVLWSVAEPAKADGYQLLEFQVDRFLIGSNSGPTAYGIISESYISIPFVFAGAWSEEVRVLGRTFDEFIEAVEAGEGS
ncbi:SMI1/KNR4 family protein [Rhizobium leguminosarum]|uniref:SMI1/KNR4 family protein n=1 Tax=Rhizobium leguminosarum TaxID=384 RepID=A0ABD7PF07_RHILE|nr:SMI1/KNR4 family protein [Rhizobium leguminosarum]TAV62064.1 SMI1/KNR4 family protein [Rhizobium leguminosarum]TAV63064.1 SMI1/KNR4 family protein [Rhizobium leguminosarum]TAW13638.1 SMI1/KNR4 family protein [Rhizobium leguminosarum]TAW26648.1 SMI1/KNR4 family protein [Rhizobium leguminosarum]TAX23809.1 SMI1/KNR4 family protein [Rhizobium leguminosarum]